MNVLVTGGAGFIGSHVCKLLASSGHSPITYDNLSRGNRSAVKWGPLEVGDLEDRRRLRAVFETYRPAAVMHFAAYAYVGESVQNPFLYYRNNVAGSLALIQELMSFERIPLVFSSSCVTYGAPQSLPISEDHIQLPINPYGRSKLIVEQMLADAGLAAGLPWIALRYFNAAGSDPEGEIGEDHDPETHLIPLVLRAAQQGSAVAIFGTDYETEDGTCVRDYVHVSDVADAHIRALHYLKNGGESCAINLANEQGYSVRQVISTAERVTGRGINVREDPRRPGDPAILIGSNARARQRLGWQPQRSRLATQIADAWNWINSGSC